MKNKLILLLAALSLPAFGQGFESSPHLPAGSIDGVNDVIPIEDVGEAVANRPKHVKPNTLRDWLYANPAADGSILFDEHATAPATPAAGFVTLYAKADGSFYQKDDTGTETLLAGGGSGDVSTDTIWDAAGDLVVADAADSAVKLPIGTGLQLLRVNAGATGLEWATVGSKWTDTGVAIHPNNLGLPVVIGSATALGKLSVDGDADEVQLLVQGNATQTSDVFVVENSAGTDLFKVNNAGDATLLGDIGINGATIAGDGTDDANDGFTFTATGTSNFGFTTAAANTVSVIQLANGAGNIEVFRVDATPEGAVTGSIGDIAIDSTNGVIYLKETGSATNTGWVDNAGAGGGLANVVEDLTPQLGGDLDVNANEITGAIDLHSTGDVILELGDAAGVNKVSIKDSGAAEVASIDSDGNIVVAATSTDTFSILDSVDQSHGMSITVESDLTAARELQITTGDATRAITLSGNPTLADWFDQAVKAASSPSFAGVTLTDVATLSTGVPNAVGELGYADDAWGVTTRDAMQFWDGTALLDIVGVLSSDTPTNGQVPKWNTGGTITWEDDAGAAGGDSVSIDSVAVVDPDFVSTGDIDFVDTTNTITANINADSIVAADLADGDWGDVSIATNVATVEAVSGANAVDSDAYVDGSIDGAHISADARGAFSEVITGGAGPTLSISAATNEGYGSVHYVDQADTINLPSVADGAGFTIITIGAVAVTVNPDDLDGIMLDGSGAFDTDGDSITNSSTAGDMVVFTYYSATGWHAVSDGNWTSN